MLKNSNSNLHYFPVLFQLVAASSATSTYNLQLNTTSHNCYWPDYVELHPKLNQLLQPNKGINRYDEQQLWKLVTALNY